MQIISGLRYLNTPQIMEVPNGAAGSVAESGAAGTLATATATDGAAAAGTPNSSNSATVPVGSTNGGERQGFAGTGTNSTVIVRRKAIIHYDLKPANILFDDFGDVKITG